MGPGIENEIVIDSSLPPEDLERFKIKEELNLKRAELQLKATELDSKLKDGKISLWFSSPLILALVGLIGTGVGASIQGYWNTKLERQKFESSLILKALETADQKEAARNLLFLVNAGLIPNLDGKKIAELANNPEQLPLRLGSSLDPFGNQIDWEVHGDNRIVKVLNDWEEKNIVTASVPQLKGVPGAPSDGSIRFHKEAAQALKGAFAEIEKQGLLKQVLSWDGGYFPAVTRGSDNRLSAHAFGTAFDINAAYNSFGKTSSPAGTKGSVRDLVPIFEKYGFRWGGNYQRPDPMHFEFTLQKGQGS
jgi:hypothetical protein